MPVAEAMRPRQQVRAMGWSLDAGMIEHLRAVTADNLRGGFGPLPRSREEVEGIGSCMVLRVPMNRLPR